MSAFTLAFQVPNLIRALVADAALSSAFVPVFSELLEKQAPARGAPARDALAGLLLVALGALTLVFILLAPVIMPLFTGDESTPALDDLTVGLSQVLFPIVVLLGLNGLVVGILNAHDHFTIPALAPLVWNLVIIAGDRRPHAAVRGRRPALRLRDRRARRHRRAARDVPAAAAPARLPAARLVRVPRATRASRRCWC